MGNCEASALMPARNRGDVNWIGFTAPDHRRRARRTNQTRNCWKLKMRTNQDRPPNNNNAKCGGATAMIDPLPPLALDARAAAKMFSLSLRTWRRMDSAGRIPPGFKLGGRKLWRRADLEQWAEWGFPDRAGFLSQQEGSMTSHSAAI